MNDKLSEALDHIGDVHLYESVRPRRRRSYWFYIIAAILALLLLLSPLLGRAIARRGAPTTSEPPQIQHSAVHTFALPHFAGTLAQP